MCDVVIVNFNAGELLSDCVSASFLAGAAQVIVVDNASEDASIAFLVESLGANDSLRIIRNSSNRGFSAACNIGARSTRADQILFLNPDCVLDPDALRIMREALASSSETGMVGGFLCNPDGSEQRGGRRAFPTPSRTFARAFGFPFLSRFSPKLFPDFLLHGEPIPAEAINVDAVSGACMMVKREALVDVGWYDEKYFLHCEDLDWCMRFHLRGWKVGFVPDAKVVHEKGYCSRSRPLYTEWHKHLGMLRFYDKFFRREYPAMLWVLVIVGVWLRFSAVSIYSVSRTVFRTDSKTIN